MPLNSLKTASWPAKANWLLLPPAVALLLIFGPLRTSTGAAEPTGNRDSTSAASASRLPPEERLPQLGRRRSRNGAAEPGGPTPRSSATTSPRTRTPAAAPDAAGASSAPSARAGTDVPPIPDTWQVVAALIGVLILGAVVLAILRRVRGAQLAPRVPGGNTPPLTLLQSMRLTPKHTVHVLRFDDRVLLVGESERGLGLLQSLDDWQSARDDAELADRDEGAVPRDMVLPHGGPRRTRAKPPRERATELPAGEAAPEPAPVNDFRSLLQRAKASLQA